MTIDTIRTICRALPDTTEDIKWDYDLVFSVGGKMFAVVCLEPPHTVAFKCTPNGSLSWSNEIASSRRPISRGRCGCKSKALARRWIGAS